jgi:hypothetical protein
MQESTQPKVLRRKDPYTDPNLEDVTVTKGMRLNLGSSIASVAYVPVTYKGKNRKLKVTANGGAQLV